MIRLGEHTIRNCGGATRREFMQVGAASFLGLSLADLVRAQESGAADRHNQVSVILLFLWGGMPQSDTFDLKPRAPDSVRGEFSEIQTAVPGIRIGQHLPRLAAAADRFTIVRSSHHNETEHPRAAHYMMTGNQVIRGQEWPNMGATVSKYAQSENSLGSVVLGPRLIDQPITPTGQDGGFLGNIYSPFRVTDPTAPLDRLAAMSAPSALTAERFNRRQQIYRTVSEFQRDLDTAETAPLDKAYERAVALTTSPQAKAAFDLAKEPEKTRDAYGRYVFGQGVLMARRLVEAGVRFVQVNWRQHPINDYGFDNHGDNFRKLKDHQLPQIDQTVSTLLADLADRGMSQRTLVLMTGEFGRTPTINTSSGRDHWPFCFSYLIAGAGIPGGRVIGASDAMAAYPAETPVSPEQTAASVLSLVGLDLEQLHASRIIDGTEGIPGLFS